VPGFLLRRLEFDPAFSHFGNSLLHEDEPPEVAHVERHHVVAGAARKIPMTTTISGFCCYAGAFLTLLMMKTPILGSGIRPAETHWKWDLGDATWRLRSRSARA
jgi:hypothetical protein